MSQVSQRSLESRFVTKVDASAGPSSCWLWTGARDGQGYGRFGVGYRSERAHRVAFALENGRDTKDLAVICHRCDNPPCVNPAHLFEGTKKDNSRDAEQKGRLRHYPKLGDAHPRTRLSNADAIAISLSVECTSVLMARYGVSRNIIKDIRAGKTWTSVTGMARRARRP